MIRKSMLKLPVLKKYPMAKAIYINTFFIPEEDLENKPLDELIADYVHLEENVEEALKTLTGREQMVLRKLLGEKLTLSAVGKEMNVTDETVRRVYVKALQRLKSRTRILDGTQRQWRVEAEIGQKLMVAAEKRWLEIGIEIEHQKTQQQNQVGTRLTAETEVDHLPLSPFCKKRLHALEITTIGDLLEKYPYNSQTNGLTGLAVAKEIDKTNYKEIWIALFTAGFFAHPTGLPDIEALKKAEYYTIVPRINIAIDDLELSVRSYNCLTRAGIESVSDIARRLSISPSEFLTLKEDEIFEEIQCLNLRYLGRQGMLEVASRLYSALHGND